MSDLSSRVDGLRMFADVLEAVNPGGVSFGDQSLQATMFVRTQADAESTVAAFVSAGGEAEEVFESDGVPVTGVSFAGANRHGGILITVAVHDDGEGDK